MSADAPQTAVRLFSGLRARLVAAVGALLVVLFVVTGLWVAAKAERALALGQQSQFDASTRQLADAIGLAALARSAALMQPSLDAFARSPGLVSVRVEDEAGELISQRAAGEPATAGTVEVVQEVWTRATAPGDEGDELGAAPAKPRLVGRVIAQFSTEAARRFQRELRWEILAVFGALGGVGLGGMLWLASSVVRRVRRLAAATSQVARGDLSPRVQDGGTDELAALARDFSAMAQSLERQRRALDQAATDLADREALAAIGRATAVIAHELKNPLGILLGAAEVAGNREKPAEARAQAAALLEEEVRRLSQTLERLLDYARPHAPTRERIEVTGLARAAAQRVKSAGGAELEVRVEGAEAWALADRLQVEQILFNLLLNAAQAGSRRVGMAISARGSGVDVEIQDDGPGIDASVREQLFRPFVTSKQRGAGLGLAGARRMARENGGDLSLAPSPQGARFVLQLAAERPS